MPKSNVDPSASALHPEPTIEIPTDELAALKEIERRMLWLSTLMIHHANNVRPSLEKSKVGGHQASSASVSSIITALYFHFLRAGDRVSIKPHASPIYHAAQYLLGNLDRKYLTTLREYKGLQAYPSRTKDPDPVDFSTGSVGLGAVAPVFAALAAQVRRAAFRRSHIEPLHLADRRRRARRGQRLGDGRRRGDPRTRQRDLDRRSQPADRSTGSFPACGPAG